jgi:hypothetical protein
MAQPDDDTAKPGTVEAVRPLPEPDELSAPYWEAASRRKFVLQRCVACRRWHFPPVRECLQCFSSALKWEEASGRATIHSRVVVRWPLAAGFAETIPYVGIAAELAEQVGLIVLADLVGASSDDGHIGDRVRVCFQTVRDGIVLPQFELAADEEGTP